ncbi:hypothetical protein [Phenylobacterium sp.]|uniref:hypothetical protein n=1 Tax=Phenylobacterium sp. TaxID=1871053 RepID=UPI0025EC7DA5|nr:hypothetical protein [Phenylobacterium sp.]
MLIDILDWDWKLRIAVEAGAERRGRLSKGLAYGRDFVIRGRVRAPGELQGKAIKVTLSPFGRKVKFGRGGLQQIGDLRIPTAGSHCDLEATLMLPEDAIPTTAASLATLWKNLQIITLNECADGAAISHYFFGVHIHSNLEAWANAE